MQHRGRGAVRHPGHAQEGFPVYVWLLVLVLWYFSISLPSWSGV
jgi:hypothetical protein